MMFSALVLLVSLLRIRLTYLFYIKMMSGNNFYIYGCVLSRYRDASEGVFVFSIKNILGFEGGLFVSTILSTATLVLEKL